LSIFGVVGHLMRKLNYPMAPAVLAIVRGPLAEPALRQSLLISGGSSLNLLYTTVCECNFSPCVDFITIASGKTFI